MRFGLNFVKDFIKFDTPIKKLALILTNLGIEVENIEKIKNDYVFEIEVTSNRYDLLSILGIAREIAIGLNKKLNFKFPKIEKVKVLKEKNIIIENELDCPFYIGRVIRDIKIKESPPWLKERLLSCGINSINNIVDITNYCMLKWGNPLHAFDLDKIEGPIFIRRAKEGEIFVGIDGKERALCEENLVIADQKKVIALAGVMGAKNSEVDINTKNIFLEAAIFSPLTIRRSRRFVGLDTESSYRFERQVNPKYLEYASYEGSYLIEKLGEGKHLGYIEVGKRPKIKTIKLNLNLNELNSFLGTQILEKEALSILKRLNFKVDTINKKFIVGVCDYRFDIKRKEDLFEEVSRVYGYDKIPNVLPNLISKVKKDSFYYFKNKLRVHLSTLGLKEIITYSLEEEEKLLKIGEKDFIKISNPLSQDLNVLRTNLFLGLLNVFIYNLNYNRKDLRFFEIAKIYFQKNNKCIEKDALALATIEREYSFFYLKAVIEEILSNLNIEYRFEEAPLENFTNCLKIFSSDTYLGFLAKANKKILDIFDFKEEFNFSQLDLNL
ncbi:MAG: phenylalanine--tRNA ligase subunit beta, partial [Candidatus Aenigmatarchaeota archaeon]